MAIKDMREDTIRHTKRGGILGIYDMVFNEPIDFKPYLAEI